MHPAIFANGRQHEKWNNCLNVYGELAGRGLKLVFTLAMQFHPYAGGQMNTPSNSTVIGNAAKSNTPNPNPNNAKPEEKDHLLRWFGFLVFIVLLVLTIYMLILPTFLPDWAERGQFGDMFGVVNTLFSGLAFSALVCALILQSRELQATRLEFSKQSAAQAEHAETALRAAKINALGALLQSYSQMLASGHTNLIDPTSGQAEILRVKHQLMDLLGHTQGD